MTVKNLIGYRINGNVYEIFNFLSFGFLFSCLEIDPLDKKYLKKNLRYLVEPKNVLINLSILLTIYRWNFLVLKLVAKLMLLKRLKIQSLKKCEKQFLRKFKVN